MRNITKEEKDRLLQRKINESVEFIMNAIAEHGEVQSFSIDVLGEARLNQREFPAGFNHFPPGVRKEHGLPEGQPIDAEEKVRHVSLSFFYKPSRITKVQPLRPTVRGAN